MGSRKIATKKDFNAEIGGDSGRIALFYSSWCPFCLSFLPAFEALAGKSVGFIKVCTDDLPDLEDAFGVEVVPTVLCFRKGKVAARLDGELGRGLSARALSVFAASCAAGGKTGTGGR